MHAVVSEARGLGQCQRTGHGKDRPIVSQPGLTAIAGRQRARREVMWLTRRHQAMGQVGAQALPLTECSPPGDAASTVVAQGPPALCVFSQMAGLTQVYLLAVPESKGLMPL